MINLSRTKPWKTLAYYKHKQLIYALKSQTVRSVSCTDANKILSTRHTGQHQQAPLAACEAEGKHNKVFRAGDQWKLPCERQHCWISKHKDWVRAPFENRVSRMRPPDGVARYGKRTAHKDNNGGEDYGDKRPTSASQIPLAALSHFLAKVKNRIRKEQFHLCWPLHGQQFTAAPAYLNVVST